MKTKSRACKAKVSKIPAESSSMAARVLSEITKSDRSVSKLEGLKQDCSQFILQKRADVPSCSRKQDLILEGCHASAASLMERNGLAGEKKDHSRMDVDGGGDIDSYAAAEGMYQHGVAKRLKGNQNDVQKAHLAGPHHENPLGESKDDGEPNIVPGTSYGSDGHHDLAPDSIDEMVVAAKKHHDPSSGNTFSQVSLETDLTEQGLCIKCDKGDQVLICSDSGCPIVVHENCMRCSASFDDIGNFYCPYCSYKRAFAEFCQARKKAALAKKSLSIFIDINMMNAHRPKRSAETIKMKESNQSSMDGDGIHLDESHENRRHREILSNQSVQAAEDHEQANAATECTTSNLLDKMAGASLVSEENNVSLTGGGDSIKQLDKDQLRRMVEQQRKPEPSIAYGGDDIHIPCREDTTSANETFNVSITKRKTDKAKTSEKHQCIRGGEQMQTESGIGCEAGIALTSEGDRAKQIDHHQRRRVVEDQQQVEPSVALCSGKLPFREEETIVDDDTFHSFLTQGKQDNEKMLAENQHTKRGGQIQAEALGTSVCLIRGGDHAQEVDDPQCCRVVQDQQQTEPSTAHCSDKLPCVEEGTTLDGETLHLFLTKGKRVNAKMFEENLHIREGEQMQAQACESSISLTRSRDDGQQLDNHQHGKVVMKRLQEPSIACDGDDHDLPCREGSSIPSEIISVSVPKKKRNNKKMVEEHESTIEAEQQMHAKANVGLETSNSPCGDTEAVIIGLRGAQRRTQSTILQPQNVDPPQEVSSGLNITAEENAGRQNEEDITFSKSGQRAAKRFSNAAFLNSRRKKLHWTAEEEEMLREGVQKFSTAVNKNLPWRKILDFGRHVFDGTRTPVDLKDKWRNILVREGSRARPMN